MKFLVRSTEEASMIESGDDKRALAELERRHHKLEGDVATR